MRYWLLAAAALLVGAAPPSPEVAMWRLDCGRFQTSNYNGGGPRDLTDSCYVIRHGSRFMLWDAGLDEGLIGHPDVSPEQKVSLKEALVPQLARLGIKPSDIAYVGISHFHGDHLGQIGHFPNAHLFIGKADFAIIKGDKGGAKLLAPWISGSAPVTLLAGDRDLFGDGTVTMIATPGHTPGHMSLLVRLPARAVLLSGDAVHLREQLTTLQAPEYSSDKTAAVAAIRHLSAVAKQANATIVVQHDPVDIPLLPSVPPPAGGGAERGR